MVLVIVCVSVAFVHFCWHISDGSITQEVLGVHGKFQCRKISEAGRKIKQSSHHNIERDNYCKCIRQWI